jgi:hypothetical protein
MTRTGKLHSKFQYYWSEYKHSDIDKVCKSIRQLMGVKNQRGNHVDWVKSSWGNVCHFLIQWEGK